MENKDKIEIPFGARDSELYECEYTIPEGYEAEIKDSKVIIRKKEPEDERIRKAIRTLILSVEQERLSILNITRSDALAWLEKQGEHKKFRDSIQVGDKVTRNEDGVLVNLSQLNRVAKKDEKQGEQKHQYKSRPKYIGEEELLGEQKPNDKVETKFHEGDWVILTAGELSTTLQIVKVDTNKKQYWFNDSSYLPIVDEECLRLWTIQDAKDGDVVVDDNLPFIFKKIDANKYSYAYCGISFNNDFIIESDVKFGEWTWMQDIKPATKEQRDLLFQNMHEAGYEWDAEKKELKKL